MISLRPVLNVLGFLFVGLATAMLVPAIFDVAAKNADWEAFVFSALMIGLVGMLLSIAVGGSFKQGLNTRQAFLLTVLSWVLLPALGALPFLRLGIAYVDAVFEAVSGFTTTGSTVLTGLDSLPPGLLVWRSIMQWLGGIGILVMAAVLLPFLRIGGMQLFRGDYVDRNEKIVSRSVEAIRLLMVTYVFLTVLCICGYVLAGMNLFDAFNHALTTISTGGFSTHDASFGGTNDEAAGWVAIVFMLLGALPFVLIVQTLRGKPHQLLRDPQVKALLVLIVILTLGLTIYLGLENNYAFGQAVLEAAFNVVSVVSGTGFSFGTAGPSLSAGEVWAPAVLGFALLIQFVGGCTGSTTGGIKIFRFLVFFGTVRSHLRRMVRPNRITSEEYSGTRLTPELVFSVLAFLVVYLGAVALLTLVLATFNIGLVDALSIAAASIGNVGPGLGPLSDGNLTYASLPDAAKWVLCAGMLLGRLELFTVLVLFVPEFWRR